MRCFWLTKWNLDNKLNRKIKRIILWWICFFNDYFVKKCIIHEVISPYWLESNGVVGEKKNTTSKKIMFHAY